MPDEGEMLNHVAPSLSAEALAVNPVRLAARTDSLWEGGAPIPAVVLKNREEGLRVTLVPSSP